jgi:hypothetical protein
MSGSVLVDSAILQVVRWALTGAGGGALAGSVTEHEVAQIAGAVAVVVGLVWSAMCKEVKRRRLKAAAASAAPPPPNPTG